MDHGGLAVIGYKDFGYAAEVFIHVNMGSYPGLLFFVDESLNISVLAISHNPDKQISINDFTSIRIGDVKCTL
jgi:hypothetical protein